MDSMEMSVNQTLTDLLSRVAHPRDQWVTLFETSRSIVVSIVNLVFILLRLPVDLHLSGSS